MAIPTPPAPPVIAQKGSKVAAKTYIWSTDAKGNLIKVEASTAKRSFATLPKATLVAIDQYLLSTNVAPTAASRKSLWSKMVDGSIAEYKSGKQTTPSEVLSVMLQNTPNQGPLTTISHTQYDATSAEATLGLTARSIGFDTSILTDADKSEFTKAITAAAAESGKTSAKKTVAGGVEYVVTPNVFDPKSFTENWLWAKVNLGDTAKLPAKAFTALSTVKNVLRNNGIDYLGNAEVNKLAVDLAAGYKSEAQIKQIYSDEAAKNYPLLAQRLKDTPGVTVMDLVTPYVNAVAKWWEVDPNTVNLSDPVLDKALRPDGTQGKAAMQSLADFQTNLKMSPQAEKTTWAHEAARSAATGIARAMGFGV